MRVLLKLSVDKFSPGHGGGPSMYPLSFTSVKTCRTNRRSMCPKTCRLIDWLRILSSRRKKVSALYTRVGTLEASSVSAVRVTRTEAIPAYCWILDILPWLMMSTKPPDVWADCLWFGYMSTMDDGLISLKDDVPVTESVQPAARNSYGRKKYTGSDHRGSSTIYPSLILAEEMPWSKNRTLVIGQLLFPIFTIDCPVSDCMIVFSISYGSVSLLNPR